MFGKLYLYLFSSHGHSYLLKRLHARYDIIFLLFPLPLFLPLIRFCILYTHGVIFVYTCITLIPPLPFLPSRKKFLLVTCVGFQYLTCLLVGKKRGLCVSVVNGATRRDIKTAVSNYPDWCLNKLVLFQLA